MAFDEDDNEATEPFLMLGFSGFDGLLQFIHWVYETFDDDDEFKEWFDSTLRTPSTMPTHVVPAITQDEDDEFWKIVGKSFKNHKEEPRDHLPGPD